MKKKTKQKKINNGELSKPSMMRFTLFFLLLIIPSIVVSQEQNESYYYTTCAPSNCGNVTVSFPFSSSEPFCGLPGFTVACERPAAVPTITLTSPAISFNIHVVHPLDTLITVSDPQLSNSLSSSNSCSAADLRRHFLPSTNFTPLYLPSWRTFLNFSFCNTSSDARELLEAGALSLGDCGDGESIYVFQPEGKLDGDSKLPAACTHAAVPVLQASLLNLLNNSLATKNDVLYVLREGFPLMWQNETRCRDSCMADGGRCGYNATEKNLTCFCPSSGCSNGTTGAGEGRSKLRIILAVTVPTTVILVAAIAVIKCRGKASTALKNFRIVSISRTDKVNVKEFIKQYQSMLPSEYSYRDVKKFTFDLREKLGGGGFGNVYKGTLANGQLVAVKVLEKSKDDGRDFVNEIASIGRIHHVNIIRLQGFCCNGPHRALIYEFMPKGSLGDLIFKEDIRQTLGAAKLLEIAKGIARGIEYLHYGCENIILHLDIKPHNVLLGNNLNPKISDFGLAKSHSRRESFVSLTGAQGTIGYMAPELFMRHLGGVSHKSDIYSYGMLLLEMILSKKTVKPENEESSRNYFPESIYEQLNRWTQMEIDEMIVKEEIVISRKMVLVALWCIQLNPVDRPSMRTVLDMLTGRIESIDVPPKPLLSPPGKTQSEHTSRKVNIQSECSQSLVRSSMYEST